MPSHDPRIDAYIDKAADFAKPILNHLREVVHKYCPEVNETWKWSFPYFEYNGSNLCYMASFRQHCAFGFWLQQSMADPDGILVKGEEKNAMGSLGKITSVKELPPARVIGKYIRQAMELIDQGEKLQRKEPVKKTDIVVPPYFLKELKKNKAASSVFDKFPPSHKKEYITWITEAKTEETRNRRMATAIEWISEGKGRNWKYEKK